jgi:hypothetical protein
LVASGLATLYSLGGIVMAYWVAAIPGQSPEQIRLNFAFWVPTTLIFIAVVGLFLYRLVRHYKQTRRRGAV